MKFSSLETNWGVPNQNLIRVTKRGKLVLRQQLLVLSRQTRKRVRLRSIDRLILVWLYRLFPSILRRHRHC